MAERVDGRTASLGQLVFDVSFSFCSEWLGFMFMGEDGLGGFGLW